MRARRRVRPSLRGVLAGAVLLVSACTSGVPGTGSPAGGEQPAGGGPAGDSISVMLALLPPMDRDELGIVSVTRWHAAAEAYGIEVPGDAATADEVLGYLSSLTSGDGGLTRASDLLDLAHVASRPTTEDFGFAPQQVAADVSAGLAPQVLSAARGDFDPDDIGEATRSGTVADEVEEVDVDGVPVLRWREDSESDLERPTSLSPIGSAGRLGLPDDATLLHARDDDGMAALVEAFRGGASLADDGDLAAVAGALDAEGALAAQLTHRPGDSDLQYAAAGIGFAWDDGGRVVLAYSTDSESLARTLASTLEETVTSGSTRASGRPWSDLLLDPEIRTEGPLVVATSTVEAPAGRWPAFLLQREDLF